VFSYVGIRDYIYTGAVSRRWNGRYKKLCHNLLGKWGPKLCTNHSNTLISAGRLQVAIVSGLDMARLQSLSDDSFIMRVSLDPIDVLMQARQYGLDWTSDLSESAAAYNKLELLQWLQQMGCPLDIPALMETAVDDQFIDILNWLRSNSAAAEWTAELRQSLFTSAGVSGAVQSLQWLLDNGAEWPVSFVLPTSFRYWQKRSWALSS
jgi:hypothetical protein